MLEVDEKRKRIALTMRLTDEAPREGSKPDQRALNRPREPENRKPHEDRRQAPPMNNAMAAAFGKLKK